MKKTLSAIIILFISTSLMAVEAPFSLKDPERAREVGAINENMRALSGMASLKQDNEFVGDNKFSGSLGISLYPIAQPPASKGRLYWDSTLNSVMVCQDGSTFVALSTGPAAGGTLIHTHEDSLSQGGQLNASSIFSAGSVPMARGGTAASLTASNGAVVYSGASAMALTGVGTANHILQSNGAATPTWTNTPTILGTNITAIPSSSISSGVLGSEVVSSSIAVGAVYPGAVAVGTYSNVTLPSGNVASGELGAGVIASSVTSASIYTGAGLGAATVPDAALSANVGLLDANQTWTGVNTYSSSMTLNNDFRVWGSTLVVSNGAVQIGGSESTSYLLTVYGPSIFTSIRANSVDSVGGGTFETVDTGQGANELYDMNQNVLTTSHPTFADLTLTYGLSATTAVFSGTITGNLSGNVTGDLTGNADTATSVPASGVDLSTVTTRFEALELSTGSIYTALNATASATTDAFSVVNSTTSELYDLLHATASALTSEIATRASEDDLLIPSSATGTYPLSISGNAATSSALAADPAGCTVASQGFTYDISAAGVSSCSNDGSYLVNIASFAAGADGSPLVNISSIAMSAMYGSPTLTGTNISAIPQASIINTNSNSFLNSSALNLSIGISAGDSITDGSGNVFIGDSAGIGNTSGSGNSAFGDSALYCNLTGYSNTVIGGGAGRGSGKPCSSFSSATLVGTDAGRDLTTGSDNILIGFHAGDDLTTGSSNIIIGYDLDASAVGASNELNIGNLILGTIGGSSVTVPGTLYADTFSGSGASLTSLPGAQVGSGVPAANIADGALGAEVVASSVAVDAVYTAAIAALAVTDAKINDVAPGKVSAGSLDSDVITSSLAATIAIPFSQLDGYPAACGAGEYISALGDSPTCSAPAGSGDVVLAATQTFTGQNTFSPNGITVTSVTLSTDLTVPNGGTGASTFTQDGVLYGNGASAIGVTAQGGANTVLTANSGAPAWSATPTITSITANATGATTYSITTSSGIKIGAGVLELPNTTSLSDGGMSFDRTNEDLAIGDGSATQIIHIGDWKTYTPSWTNLTTTGGTLNYARYQQIGKLVIVQVKFTLGAGSAMGTGPLMSLPVTAEDTYVAGDQMMGHVAIDDTGTAGYIGVPLFTTTTTAELQVTNSGTSYASRAQITASVPMTWASTDIIRASIIYEAE